MTREQKAVMGMRNMLRLLGALCLSLAIGIGVVVVAASRDLIGTPASDFSSASIFLLIAACGATLAYVGQAMAAPILAGVDEPEQSGRRVAAAVAIALVLIAPLIVLSAHAFIATERHTRVAQDLALSAVIRAGLREYPCGNLSVLQEAPMPVSSVGVMDQIQAWSTAARTGCVADDHAADQIARLIGRSEKIDRYAN